MTSTVKPGDWMCSACGNHNFASREVCNKCSGPKTDGSGYSGYGPVRATALEIPRGAPYPRPFHSNHGGCMRDGNGYGGLRPQGMMDVPHAVPYMRQPQYGHGGGSVMKEGDWMCPHCTNHNYASRVNCNSCGSVRDGMKQGDWVCRSCRNHNFASRQQCNKCQEPKSPEAGALGCNQGGFGMMMAQKHAESAWMPPGGVRMFSGGMMPLAMPKPMQLDWVGRAASMRYSTTSLGVLPGNMKPGDWLCPSCNNHNYASRVNCNSCGGVRNGMKQGDWVCRSCRNHNFASRHECNKCHEPKPSDQ